MRVTTKSDLKQIGETVKLTLIDNLIQRVEVALAKEMAERYQCFNQAATDNKVFKYLCLLYYTSLYLLNFPRTYIDCAFYFSTIFFPGIAIGI